MSLCNPGDHPLVAQIWGTDPKLIYEAVKLLLDYDFAGVDLNMGCPQPKITRKGACGGLIKNPNLAYELVRAAQEAAKTLPVSVKTRIGWKQSEIETWIAGLLELKPAALTVHGRTVDQMSDGLADWTAIAEAVALKNQISPHTIVIGNGDLEIPQEVDSRFEQTGVDGLMVARGIFKDPFIFRRWKEIKNKAPLSPAFADLALKQRVELARYHLDLFEEFRGDGPHFEIMKKFFKVYLSGTAEREAVRERLNLTHSWDQARAILIEHSS